MLSKLSAQNTNHKSCIFTGRRPEKQFSALNSQITTPQSHSPCAVDNLPFINITFKLFLYYAGEVALWFLIIIRSRWVFGLAFYFTPSQSVKVFDSCVEPFGTPVGVDGQNGGTTMA